MILAKNFRKILSIKSETHSFKGNLPIRQISGGDRHHEGTTKRGEIH